MQKQLLLIATLFIGVYACAQNVGINTSGTAPDNSALLDMNTGNTFTSPNGKGLLIPNVPLASSTDAATISSPAPSLLVYNTGTGGLAPAGYYYNSGTALSPDWVAINKTHVIISEGMSPPNAISGGGGSSNGGAQTFGYGGWLLGAPWYSTTAIAYTTLSNPGTGAYIAPSAETIYNVNINGWVYNHTSSVQTNVTVYLMEYSIGTSTGGTTLTNTVTGTSEASIYVNGATGIPAGKTCSFTMSASSISLAQGDILVLVLQSNNLGNYIFYAQAQLEFDVFN